MIYDKFVLLKTQIAQRGDGFIQGTRVIFVYLATIIPYLERDPMKKVIKLTFTYNRERLKFHTQ